MLDTGCWETTRITSGSTSDQATQAMSEPHGSGQLTDTPDVRPELLLFSLLFSV